MRGRTRLFRFLKQQVQRSSLTNSQNHQPQTLFSRREFISNTLSATALAGMGSIFGGCSKELDIFQKKSQPSIAIIGAGLAGLTCAYGLYKHGIAAHIYEANNRVGGRLLTVRDKLPQGQMAELGGELFDSVDKFSQQLIKVVGLNLIDVKAVYPNDQQEIFFIDGTRLKKSDLAYNFKWLARRLSKIAQASESSQTAFNEMDNTSIHSWLLSQNDIDPALIKLINVAYLEEYGLETHQQSLYNLLSLIDFKNLDKFRLYGDSDERFHIVEGNDALTARLSEAFPDNIFLGNKLEQAQQVSNGRYKLTFAVRDGRIRRNYDKVIFALPFSVLRQVEISGLSLPAEKLRMISELGYGQHSKLVLSFASRPWHEKYKSSGYVISNNGLQTMWDSSRGQEGKNGLLTIFQGGNAGVKLGEGSNEDRAKENLPRIDQIYPGTSQQYIENSALRMAWAEYPYSLGSYTCYKPGQAQWSGMEGERVGNLHFCGEHTSIDAQGFLEGACESGFRVVSEVVQDFSKS